jgi:hypothetical protein
VSRAKAKPGASWRVSSRHPRYGFGGGASSLDHPRSIIDEVVIDGWLHIEQMDARQWWVRVGNLHVNVELRTDGSATLNAWVDGASVLLQDHDGGPWVAP